MLTLIMVLEERFVILITPYSLNGMFVEFGFTNCYKAKVSVRKIPKVIIIKTLIGNIPREVWQRWDQQVFTGKGVRLLAILTQLQPGTFNSQVFIRDDKRSRSRSSEAFVRKITRKFC
jgi:hypothetical protein